MIIATIGNTNMKLASLSDAEVLMKISANATIIDDIWDETTLRYFHVKKSQKITIAIVDDDLMITAEEQQSINKRRDERRAKAAAEGGAA